MTSPVRTPDDETLVTASSPHAALALLQQVASVSTDVGISELLRRAAMSLGAVHAAFVSFIRDDATTESFRFLLACDPGWCIEYERHGWYAQDPWLRYAGSHSEPAFASDIPLLTAHDRGCIALAEKYGVHSAYIVPAPALATLSRIGVLILGSQYGGYFESAQISTVRVLARGLAMELHEWWLKRVRQEIIERHDITSADLALLSFERAGLGSKQIAAKLNTSPSAIDSRFQRLNAKFSTPNPKATARLAAEYGLI